MIELPQELARRFRAVLRRSLLTEGPRGPQPVLWVCADPTGLTLQARHDDVALHYHQPGEAGLGTVAFRADLLAQVEGRRAGPVALEALSLNKGRARWAEAGVSRTIEFETAAPDTVPAFPELPKQFSPMPADFLPALAQAALTTPRDNVRFSLSRVQLRGKAGQIAATDGKQLLIQSGFPFPWTDDVLVPKVPAFGLKELHGEEPVEVGRTKDHIAVRAGGWTFLLQIDGSGRYPDINRVIPRVGPQTTCLHLHPEDSVFLLEALPRLPGRDEEHSPITLDLGTQAFVRAQDPEQGHITEVVLTRSEVTGPPVSLVLGRYYLGRALQLGFAEVQLPGADHPLVCRDKGRLYLWMSLTGQPPLTPGKGMHRLVSTGTPVTPSPPQRRNNPMPPVQPNGQGPERDHPTPPQADQDGSPELLAEADALRGLLQDAAVRAGRLVAALKQQRRQTRVVRQAMESLRRLHHLGG